MTLKKFLHASFVLVIAFGLGLNLFNLSANAQSNNTAPEEKTLEAYVKEKFTSVCKNNPPSNPEAKCEYINLVLLDGTILPPILLNNELNALQVTNQDWRPDDRVIVVQTVKNDGSSDYYIRDPDRQVQLWSFGIFILVVAFAIARVKGLMAILALVLSTFVIFALFIPQILNGGNMLFWGFISTLIILIINQLIGHGFTKLSMVGLFSGFLTLIAAWAMGWLSITFFRLTGGSGEGIVFLRADRGPNFDFKGLFLVGTMIGVTGAIDDVVAAQVSSIQELVTSNRNLKFYELYSKSMRIGKEHIVSMVNTLFLAYAGASLPLLLLFYTNLDQTITQLMSREDLTEEIVRSGVGSLALLFVVPLSTFCACLYFKRPEWLTTGRKK